VDVLLQLAQADRGVLRQLTARFDVPAAPDELVAATCQAITDATNLDERDINRNFAGKCDLPAAEIIARCSAMLNNDRVRLIARKPLQSLRNRFQTAAAR
jgi:hypothetical protein